MRWKKLQARAPSVPRVVAAVAVLQAAGGFELRAQPAGDACVAPGAAVRLDHVPIAVRDIEAAAESLAGFGFSIKPGRPHDNGLDNRHIRFRDGSGLELMTVREPRDALARSYARLIEDGGGGAYLALAGPPVDSVLSVLGATEPGLAATRSPAFDWAAFPSGHPLHAVFLVDIRSRPPDRPEHLEHANGALGLAGVWVAVEEPDRLVALLERLGGRDCGMSGHPEHLYGRAVGVDGGTVHVVDAGLWEADPGSAPVLAVAVAAREGASPRRLILENAGALWIELAPASSTDAPREEGGRGSSR